VFDPVRPDWLGKHTESILEPELPIVDPHHHHWDRVGNRYLLPDLLADTGSGHNIVATVFVECRAMYREGGPEEERSLGETEFVNGIAAMSASGGYGATRACEAIVGNVNLRLIGDAGRARDMLARHVAVSGGRFKGIRNGSAWHPEVQGTTAAPPQGLLMDPAFRKSFAALGALGLSFDGWLFHTQLGEFADLARAFPGTTMILDHFGGPIGIGPFAGKRSEVFEVWKKGIVELAKCPNVNVKVGGLAMKVIGFGYAQADTPPSSEQMARDWKPYVETTVEAFGANRCMFESNFPVDKGGCSYAVMWNAFKRLAAGCSAADKNALFSGTASRVYRLVTA
jgi:predicted TIM-barrel fold metal-dependent hydrolase